MDTLLYYVAKLFIVALQALPLRGVARLGRAGGAVAFWIDARHRKVAIKNLSLSFPEKTAADIRAIAKENFRRLGENYLCAIKTAAMTAEELKPHFKFIGVDKIMPPGVASGPRSLIVAIGHFGNFELYARFGQYVPAFQCATTYRALRQPALNRLMQAMREKSGCLFFERRTDAAELKAAMAQKNILLGLLADQHSTLGGVRIPFFGRDCSTNAAPAVFALRYHCALHTGICYRTGLAQWQIEVGDEIPTRDGEHPRGTEAIMRDVNRAFEAAIRRDPANWFWVHNRWKPVKMKTP